MNQPENGNQDDGAVKGAHEIYEAYAKYKTKRLEAQYSNEYRLLLNDNIEEAAGRIDHGNALGPSQLGVSTWTSAEKESFFHALSRSGQDNVEAISVAIGTKSCHEVAEYLELLKTGRQELLSRPPRAQDGAHLAIDVPAACEIGSATEAALDLAAEAIGWSVEQSDRAREQTRHGESWLLDDTACTRLEDQKARATSAEGSLNDNNNTVQSTKATEFLHLQNWLDLTKVLTCYNETYEETWAFHGGEASSQRMTIYQTAFGDFYNLAVSLTRRLVHATMFQATSRLRALDGRKRHMDEVRHQDVLVACQVLGLKNDWSEFWTGCARRNRLEVFTREVARNTDGSSGGKPKLTSEIVLDYTEVERRLQHEVHDNDKMTAETAEEAMPSVELDPDLDYLENQSDSDYWTSETESDSAEPANETNRSRPASSTASSSLSQSSSDLDSDSESNSDPDSDPDSDLRSNSSSRSLAADPHHRRSATHSHPDVLRDKQEDAQLEILDQQASRAEEAHLMTLLRQPAPFPGLASSSSLSAGGFQTSSRLPRKRTINAPEDLIDWRKKIPRRMSEWERFGEVVEESEFAAVARRGRDGQRRRLEVVKSFARVGRESRGGSLDGSRDGSSGDDGDGSGVNGGDGDPVEVSDGGADDGSALDGANEMRKPGESDETSEDESSAESPRLMNRTGTRLDTETSSEELGGSQSRS